MKKTTFKVFAVLACFMAMAIESAMPAAAAQHFSMADVLAAPFVNDLTTSRMAQV